MMMNQPQIMNNVKNPRRSRNPIHHAQKKKLLVDGAKGKPKKKGVSNRPKTATQERTSRKTDKVKTFIKRMKIPLRSHYFYGEDPIRVLDFLVCFTRETNNQQRLDSQAFETLPSLSEEFAVSEYNYMVDITPVTKKSITCWPKAVKYLLINYAQTKTNYEGSTRPLEQGNTAKEGREVGFPPDE